MNYDLALFSDDLLPSRGLARHSDPETSQKAAQAISGATEGRILTAFRSQFKAYPSLGRDHGLTDDELCEWITPDAREWPTIKTARSRLSRKQLLANSGQVRLSTRGFKQTVWILRAP